MSSSTSTARTEVQIPANTPRISEAHKQEVAQNARATVDNAKATAKMAAGTGKGLWHGTKDMLAAAPGKAKYVGFDAPKAGLTKLASATANGVQSGASAATQGVKNITQPATTRTAVKCLVGAALCVGAAWASVVFDLTLQLVSFLMLHHLMLLGAAALTSYAVFQLVKRGIAAVANRSANTAQAAAESVAATARQAKANLPEVTEPATEDALPSKHETAALASDIEATLAAKSAEVTARENTKAQAEKADAELPAARATVAKLEAAKGEAEDNAERLAAAKAEVARLEKMLPVLRAVQNLDDIGQLKQQLANKNDLLADKDNFLAEIQAQHDAVKAEKDAAVQAERDAARAKIDAAEATAAKATAEAEASRVDLSDFRKTMAKLNSTMSAASNLEKEAEAKLDEADKKQGGARASVSVEQAA